eukprot:gene15247-21329_t
MTNPGEVDPSAVPANCPGTSSEKAGKESACAGCPNQQACASAPKGADPDLVAIAARMANIKHKILVLSGKGGVGKSTFSAQLAFALVSLLDIDIRGPIGNVGLLDIDICGPSVPKMLGLEGQEVHQSNEGWSPVYVEDNLAVMSIGFMLPNPDEAVIWRGPRKNGLIKQFLRDVAWGDLDYLVVDAPPGTSDEHITIAQCLQTTPADGALIVTTPQQVSIIDVRKEISFCKKVGLNVLGVVENMSGLAAPIPSLKFSLAQPSTSSSSQAAEEQDVTERVMAALRSAFPEAGPELSGLMSHIDVFDRSAGGADKMCKEMGVKFLGRVPLDPALGRAAERGCSVFESMTRDPASGEAPPGRSSGDTPSVCLAAMPAIVTNLTK